MSGVKTGSRKKPRRRTTIKIVLGCLVALFVVASGEDVCGYGFGLFDACFFEVGYFLRMGLLELSAALLAIALLLSAFVDVFRRLGPIRLLRRDVESVADFSGDE